MQRETFLPVYHQFWHTVSSGHQSHYFSDDFFKKVSSVSLSPEMDKGIIFLLIFAIDVSHSLHVLGLIFMSCALVLFCITSWRILITKKIPLPNIIVSIFHCIVDFCLWRDRVSVIIVFCWAAVFLNKMVWKWVTGTLTTTGSQCRPSRKSQTWLYRDSTLHADTILLSHPARTCFPYLLPLHPCNEKPL